METGIRNSKKITIAIFSIFLITAPLLIPQHIVSALFLFFIYIILTESWNLLAGYSGMFSLAQSAFIGISGYSVAVLTGYYGINLWVSFAASILVVAFTALIMSLFIFRVKGMFFGVLTMLLANTVMYFFSNWKFVNYSAGLFIKSKNYPTTATLYYIGIAMVVVTILTITKLLRSKVGLGLMAMRDDEVVSQSLGVDIFRTKLICWFIGAILSGIGGGLFYISTIYIMPSDAFSISWSVRFVFITVIGGMGTISGPIIGSFIWVFLSQWLNEFPFLSQMILGIFAITVMLIAPKGISGELEKKFRINVLSSRRIMNKIQKNF